MPSPTPSTAAEPRGSFQVLVVDDNEDNRDLLRVVLKRKGFEVIEAGDGVEAIKMAYLKRPDVILMDISMPVMDGLESVRQLQGVELTRSIPVIVISAHCADPAVSKKAIDAGCLHCLPKPFDINELVTIVQGIEASSRA